MFQKMRSSRIPNFAQIQQKIWSKFVLTCYPRYTPPCAWSRRLSSFSLRRSCSSENTRLASASTRKPPKRKWAHARQHAFKLSEEGHVHAWNVWKKEKTWNISTGTQVQPSCNTDTQTHTHTSHTKWKVIRVRFFFELQNTAYDGGRKIDESMSHTASLYLLIQYHVVR